MRNHRPAIAIGNYDFRPSGTVVKSIEIATAAFHAGLPVELWVVRDEGSLRSRVPDGIPVVETGSALRLRNRGLDLAINIPPLAAALRRRPPRLFLSGGNHLHLAARAALLASGKRREIRFGTRASNSSRHGQGSGLGRALRSRLDSLKYSGSDFVVAVAHELADEISRILPRQTIIVIPNGVDIGKVRRLSDEPFDHPFLAARAKDSPILATMGRLTRQKGFDILIRALARIEGLSPRLLIVGEGSPSETATLRTLVNDEGLTDRVAFLGYQENPFAILSRSDMFVSSSRWEGASNALIEALACGLPIAATNCPTGNREVVEKGPFGTLAPIEDPEGLARAIVLEWHAGRSRDFQKDGALNWSLDRCMEAWTMLLREEFERNAGKSPDQD